MRVTRDPKTIGWIFAGAFLVLVGTQAGAEEAPRSVRFNRDIRPILVENCYQCHGPDKDQRKADLRLDVRDVAVELGAIAPGKVDESELVARISSDDPDEMMPPPKSRKRLTPAQKALLKKWIDEGAVYEGHWSYEKPVRPEAPAGSGGLDSPVARRARGARREPPPAGERRPPA